MNAQDRNPAASAERVLEFDTVLEAIAAVCTCEPGQAEIAALRPRLGERAWADAEQAIVEDAGAFFQAGGDLSLAGAIDARPLLERTAIGASLSGSDLRRIADTEHVLRAAVANLRADKRSAGPLKSLVAAHASTDELIAAINRAVDPGGKITDDASQALSSIRRQQRMLHDQIRERCKAITHSPELAKMLSEPIVTVRAGRYVVPVRSEFAHQFPGVAHDQSASGATVFMEPLASVEANNRLRGLEAAEEREVARVLAELSARVGSKSTEIAANAGLVGRLDSIAARARFGLARAAQRPQIVGESVIRVVAGRHPLLRREAVPLDFEIGDGIDAIVISGPNMGGKTVVLKTIGLFVLLAYTGIPLPASAGTVIGGFTKLTCVIGDEQSIAQDLSSFSAHLKALKAATASADSRALILVDEIGSGTEPGAGAALAQACIETMIRAGAKVVVSTHFTQLKTFAAAHDRVRNASMLFDPASYAPTYTFAMGIPGQSLAFALARSMAMDARVIARAETLLGIDAQNLERTFEQLASERNRLKQMQAELEDQTARAQRTEQGMRQRIASLEQEKEAFERRASAELNKAVEDVRAQLVENAQRRSDIAAKQAAKPLPDSDQLLSQTLQEMRRSLGLEARPSGSGGSTTFSAGDEVYVQSFDARGTVSEVYDSDLLVTMGNVKTLVPKSDVLRSKPTPTGRSNVISGSSRNRGPESTTREPQSNAVTSLDVRGMSVDEAWPLVDKALDNASLSGLHELRVIHGRGTGRLSHGIREFLKEHPQVDSLTSAPEREGGSGVTIVQLR